MVDSEATLWQTLADGAQAVLASSAAVLSELQQQLTFDGSTVSTSSSTSSSSSSSGGMRNRVLRRLLNMKEEFMAHLVWSSPLLQPSTHIPLPTVWDARTILAFFDCLRSIQHSFVPTHSSDDLDSSSSSSGGDGDLTLPPVTAALVTGLLLVFTRPGGVALRDVALSPFCVVDRREYWRLLSCHMVHLDAAHLLTNLAALLPDASALEAGQGSLGFGADLLLLALASSLAYIGSAVLHKELLGRPGQYYSMVTVGASSLGFALKVWAGCRKRRQEPFLYLLSIPSQVSWLPTLALTHLLVPQASFTSHMAGVAAGLGRAYLVQPVLHGCWHVGRSISRSSSRAGRRLGEAAEQQQQSSTAAAVSQRLQQPWRQDQRARYLAAQQDPAGTAGYDGSSGRHPHGSSSSSGSWYSWLVPSAEFLLQLGCVGGAVGVYLAVTHSRGQQGRSSLTSSLNLYKMW